MKDIPHLNELSRRYKNEEFAVVGVTLQSGWAQDIKKDMDTRDIQTADPILVGDDDVEEAFGGVLAFPTTLLVGRDGRIHKKYVGSTDDKAAEMEREIRALLGEPAAHARIFHFAKDRCRAQIESASKGTVAAMLTIFVETRRVRDADASEERRFRWVLSGKALQTT